MNIERTIHKLNTYPSQVKSDPIYEGRIGFWARVSSIDVKNNWVDVENDQGIIYKSIPLATKEWVVDHNNYVSGERNLPPVNTRVFVLVPNGKFTDAFVLCSGYPQYEPGLQTGWGEPSERENKREFVTQGGWTIIEDITNGNLTISTPDHDTISLTIFTQNNETTSQEVRINAFGNTFAMKGDTEAGPGSVLINGNLEVLK